MRHLNRIAIDTISTPQVAPTGIGTAIPLSVYSRASAQVVFLGAVGALGTLTLQISNDKPNGTTPGNFTPTYWSTLSSVVVTGAGITTAALGMIGFAEVCHEWIRVLWSVPVPNGAQQARVTVVALGWGGQ